MPEGEGRRPEPLGYAPPPAAPARGWTFMLVAIGVSAGILLIGALMLIGRHVVRPVLPGAGAPGPPGATSRPAVPSLVPPASAPGGGGGGVPDGGARGGGTGTGPRGG